MDPFQRKKFYARKKFLKIFGGEVRIYDDGRRDLLFFVKQKAFKLREDISVYSDESKATELLRIQTKSVFDIAGTYDITDSRTGEKVGALRRQALASFARDTWSILDANGSETCVLKEDSILLALLRRWFLGSLLPQRFTISAGSQIVGHLHQSFNPFVPQYDVDFSMDQAGQLDTRLGIAAVILLQFIEGKQGG